MTERDAFELRFGASVRGYLGQVSSDLDPVELAHRIAAREPRRRGLALALTWRDAAVPQRLWVPLLLTALLAALVGGMLIAGSQPAPRLSAEAPPASPTATPAVVPQPSPAATQQTTFTAVSESTYLSVSTGGDHTCAIKTDGTLDCWGLNASGQAVPPDGTYSAVSAGGHHTCAIRTDGTLACWGMNLDGQTAPPVGGTYAVVDAGSWHTCAIRTDGTLECWGMNSAGETIVPAGTYSAVGAGQTVTCAIRTDGTLVCWGYDGGDGNLSPPPGRFVSVDTQQQCAIRTDGTLACWGADALSPPLGSYVVVGGDWGGPCALRTDGTLTCWGPEALPPPPAGIYTTLSTSLPDYEACAIRPDGKLTCWGRDWIAATDMGGWMGPTADLIPALGRLFPADFPQEDRGRVELGLGGSGCSVTQASTTFSVGDAIHIAAYLEREVQTDEGLTLRLSGDEGQIAESDVRMFDAPGVCLTGLLHRAYVAPPWTNLTAFSIDWPVGHYRVDFFASGTSLAHGEFEVR